MLRGALLTSDMFVPHVPLRSHHWLGFMLRANRTQCCHSRKKTLAAERLLVLCDHAADSGGHATAILPCRGSSESQSGS